MFGKATKHFELSIFVFFKCNGGGWKSGCGCQKVGCKTEVVCRRSVYFHEGVDKLFRYLMLFLLSP